jgi:hypothetical protein
MLPGFIADGPGASVRRLRPLMIRLTVVALLVALNSFVGEGGAWSFQHVRPAGRWLLFFSLGWQVVEWPLLAFWLAWSSGSFLSRLSVGLAAIALRAAVYGAWDLAGTGYGISLVWYVLFSVPLVLGLYGLTMPLRDCTAWSLVGRSQDEPVLATWQWSLRQLLAWTTFLAIPLASAQLANQFTRVTESDPRFWLALGWEFGIGVLVTGTVAIAVLSERLAWQWRLLMMAAAPLVAFRMRVVYGWLVGSHERVADSAWWGVGLFTAALVNVLVLRWCGLRWRRMEASPDDDAN